MTGNEMIQLYVHIPFCVRKCNYCDFLSFPADESMKRVYVEALISQVKSEAAKACEKGYKGAVSSIYFGGGTPSLLNPNQLSDIMSCIRENFVLTEDCEKTIEVNPGTIDEKGLRELKRAGFNRLSIGMQSANEEELKMLGRIHSYEQFEECFVSARKAGFNNINIDIMTALPGQNRLILFETLEKVMALSPEHVSAYSLIIEEATPFYDMYGEIEGPVVGEKMERYLYWECTDRLLEAGYSHYEISNYSKPGYESRHNCGYWRRKPYIGIGLGAASLIRILDKEGNEICEKRIKNESSIDKYILNPMDKEEVSDISRADAMDETMFLGLRMADGVDTADFISRFGYEPIEIYGKSIRKYEKEGLLILDDMRCALSRQGVDYGNYVFEGFVR